jgi:cobalamin biosynthesis protein CobD/CbiB
VIGLREMAIILLAILILGAMVSLPIWGMGKVAGWAIRKVKPEANLERMWGIFGTLILIAALAFLTFGFGSMIYDTGKKTLMADPNSCWYQPATSVSITGSGK